MHQHYWIMDGVVIVGLVWKAKNAHHVTGTWSKKNREITHQKMFSVNLKSEYTFKIKMYNLIIYIFCIIRDKKSLLRKNSSISIVTAAIPRVYDCPFCCMDFLLPDILLVSRAYSTIKKKAMSYNVYFYTVYEWVTINYYPCNKTHMLYKLKGGAPPLPQVN